MGFRDDVKTVWNNLLTLDDILNDSRRLRVKRYSTLRDYYRGAQRQQLKVKTGQADDNITLNFVGLIIDRGIAMLLGEGIDFDMGGEEEEDERQDYIDEVWLANKKDILLQKVAQFGGSLGTCYIKILPDTIESRTRENIFLPRLIALDPLLMEIITDPEDIDTVHQYVMRYNVKGFDGNETARKEITERILGSDGRNIGWEISNWYASYLTGGNWKLLYEPVIWEYEFPPILHWQNLPLAGNIYGESDISNIIDLQDRINFIASNISRIIRYHAHPRTYGISVNAEEVTSWGPDEMRLFPNSDAKVGSLEMQSDLGASQAYLLNLRQALFDISRTVDISSMADKLGALTNFGLRVLYMDAAAKLNGKKELYGEALTELNHRLLVLEEISPNDGGEIVWPETLPQDESEEVEGLGFDLEKGIVSKQTVAQVRGYDWEIEQERIDEEKAAGDNIGAALLRAFERGE